MPAYAQQDSVVLTGQVMSGFDGAPLTDVVVSIPGSDQVAQTDGNGKYRLTLPAEAVEVMFWMPGYYSATLPILGRRNIVVTLVPDSRVKYYDGEPAQHPLHRVGDALYQRDFRLGAVSLEQAIQGQFAGLNVIRKGGMPGDGAAMHFRGIRSFEGTNTPLVVLNGVPYMPDAGLSPIIGGYSANPFNPFHIRDIHHVRLLKGAETALYGSLGSNGVLLIETSAPEDMETVIEFSGHYGVAQNRATLPVLNTHDFKSLIGDVGLTQFEDMADLLNFFPFLRDDPGYYYNFLYNAESDWQGMIYRPAFVTDNHLRVKGGDAVAKYNLSLGVTNQGGTLDNSVLTRYSTRLNASVGLGRKIDLLGTVGLSYLTGNLHEQGMLQATNPILTALNKAPILSPYTKDEYNNELPTYDVVRQFNISNPLAVLHTTRIRSDVYDVFVNAGLNYRPNADWTLGTTFGVYTNYTRQSTFIPGLSSRSIVPLENGIALNTSRSGSGQVSNLFYRLSAQYEKQLGANRVEAGGGYQLMVVRNEFDAGRGRNTSSDFYRTLSHVSVDGRAFWGFNEPWNWMSTYAYGRYHWHNLLSFSAYLSVDGASSTGAAADRFGFFPGGEVRWQLANLEGMKANRWLDQLDIRIGYALTGNSQYSSKLSQPAYTSQLYRQLSGIIVGNIPNNSLRWEDNRNFDAAIDLGVLNKRIRASLGYYQTRSTNLVQARGASPVAGLGFQYVNGGEISNRGFEVDVSAALIEKRDVALTVGGTFSTYNSEVASLGGDQQRIHELADGVAMISAVGQAPYAFYGFEANEVMPSASAAAAAGLVDFKGLPFSAGDIRFTDRNADGVIDRADRTVIGDPTPDFFGGAYFDVRYKQLSLTGHFNFSYGNEIYNGVRRNSESMESYANQSTAVLRRWKADGQVTDIPRAEYGDPMGNARFSSRWIEDGSFLRLANLTLRYRVENARIQVLNGAEIYVVGENLATWTKYLGFDPETTYGSNPMYMGLDYGNLAQPQTFRAGINLTF